MKSKLEVSARNIPRIARSHHISYYRSRVKPNTNGNETLAWIVQINQGLIGGLASIYSKLCNPFYMVMGLVLYKICHSHVTVLSSMQGGAEKDSNVRNFRKSKPILQLYRHLRISNGLYLEDIMFFRELIKGTVQAVQHVGNLYRV